MSIEVCNTGDGMYGGICSTCNSAAQANGLLALLVPAGEFALPDLDITSEAFKFPSDASADMYKPVAALTIADLTTRTIKGDGCFDALMESFSVHLKGEFTAGRITGAEYTKAYTAVAESAMQGGITYLLGRDQAYWQSQLSQIQALTARVQFEAAKAQMLEARMAAMNGKAAYALTKLKLSTEEATYCTALYNLQQIMPHQQQLVIWQGNAQRGQTADSLADGTTVAGILGKQKALYTQQITSYQRDSEYKAAKVFSDAWIAQKTIDEGLLAPTNFTNASVDEVLTKLKTNNGLS